MKILIADDSKLIRDRLIGFIETVSRSTNVQQATDGVETLEKSYAFKPDIITLDIQMPHKNGFQVLKDISQNEFGPVILMFTNYIYPQYRKKCLSLGASRFFNKSTEFEEMFEELNRLISKNINSLGFSENIQGQKW